MFIAVAGFLALLAGSGLSLPTIKPFKIETQHHAKRWEAGPQIGAANFPGPRVQLRTALPVR